tara:strand:- start:680 stop:1321 length:642 start_codon:yes stop_codon:yes gene_type:complete
MDGASFLNKFREKFQQLRDTSQQIQQGGAETALNDSASQAQADIPPGGMPQDGGNAALMSDQMMNTLGTNNPNSNGTGSGRANFSPPQGMMGMMSPLQMGPQKMMATLKQRVQAKLQDLKDSRPAQGEYDAAAIAKEMAARSGASMGVKPKKKAKAEAKAYAAKKGLRGKARKEMVKEAKKNQNFDPATNTQSKKTEEADKKVDLTGSQSQQS